MGSIFAILFSAILVDNFVLSRFLGICPFLGVSRKTDTALGMGMAVTFVMSMAALVTWLIDYFVLTPYALQYLQTIVFILVIASLVQFVEMVVQKLSPNLYQSLGVFLPLITTNCAVLGMALLSVQSGYNLFEAVVFGVAAAIGFTLALVILASIRERLELVFLPKYFQGASLTLVIAGILSIAFMGFKGML